MVIIEGINRKVSPTISKIKKKKKRKRNVPPLPWIDLEK